MRVHYHVFERSTFDDEIDQGNVCAICGNPERSATGTGHVETEGEANRLNRERT